MKKRYFSRKYKTVAEMDRALEISDLSKEFMEKGAVKKPMTKQISLALPEGIVAQIDQIAKKVGVSRQPLLKVWIHDRLKQELHP
jgi:hypothetical protein